MIKLRNDLAYLIPWTIATILAFVGVHHGSKLNRMLHDTRQEVIASQAILADIRETIEAHASDTAKAHAIEHILTHEQTANN